MPKKRNSRRSSILKKSPSRNALEDVDMNVDPTEYTRFDNVTNTQTKYLKRVSFADTNQIKEIIRVADIAKDWHDSSASDNSLSKLHDASSLTTPLIRKNQPTPSNMPEDVKDLQSLLKGPIVEQGESSDKLNETSGSCAMDMTNVSEIEAAQSQNDITGPPIQQKSPFTPGFSFFDNSKLGFDDVIPSSQNIDNKENVNLEVEKPSIYTKDFLQLLKLTDAKNNVTDITKEALMRPHVNPPSYSQCLSGVAGRRSILLTPLEPDDEHGTETSRPQILSQKNVSIENIESVQDEPMDQTVIFDKSVGEMDITCTNPLGMTRTKIENDMSISGIGLPEIGLPNLEKVSQSQDQHIPCSDLDDGMDFTCTTSAFGSAAVKLCNEVEDDVFESAKLLKCSSGISSNQNQMLESNEIDRTQIFNAGDDSMMEFTSVTGLKPMACTALASTNKDAEFSQISQNNTDAKEMFMAGDEKTQHFNCGSDDMDITKALFVPQSVTSNQPVESNVCSNSALSSTNDEERTQHFVAGSDEMDITKPMLLAKQVGLVNANYQKEPEQIHCNDEGIFVPDTQPMTLNDRPGSVERTDSTDLVNETVVVINLNDDNTKHFTTGTDCMDIPKAIQIEQPLFRPDDMHSENSGYADVQNDENDIFVPDTQEPKNHQNEIDTGVNKPDENSMTWIPCEDVDTIPSSGDSEDIDNDTLNTSSFRRKMSRARNSIAVYKSRQEREISMRQSSSDTKTEKDSEPDIAQAASGQKVKKTFSVVEDTELVLCPNKPEEEMAAEDTVIPETPIFLDTGTKPKSPVKTIVSNGQKVATKRNQDSSSIMKEVDSMQSMTIISASNDNLSDSALPAKIPKISSEMIETKESDSLTKHKEMNQIKSENFLKNENLLLGVEANIPVQESLQIRLATGLDKSIMEDINRKQSQKKDQNITVDEFLQDYAHVNIKNLKKSRQSIIVPSLASQQITGLKELFKAVNWTSKEVTINECFVERMKNKIEWLEEDINKIEKELSENNPEVFKNIRIEGDESDELCERLQKLSSCCKSLGKAYWKRDACKLYKGLHQAKKKYLEEDLAPATSKLGSPQDLLDSALKEIEQANIDIDKMIEQYNGKEEPPTETQAKSYEENQEKLSQLEKKHEKLLNGRSSSVKEREEMRSRRRNMMNRILNGDDGEIKKRKMHKEMVASLKIWEKYSQWKMTITSDKNLHFSFLSDSLSLIVEFENKLEKYKDGEKIDSYKLEVNTLPDNVIPSEVENFKMFHKLIQNCLKVSQLKVDYPDFASLKTLLRRMSILSSAVDELIDDIDWISCQFTRCSCTVSSEDNSCDVWFQPTMVGVDSFNIKFFLSSPDASEDAVQSVLKYGFQVTSHEYSPGRRQLDYLGKAEVAEIFTTVPIERRQLRRSVEAILKKMNNTD